MRVLRLRSFGRASFERLLTCVFVAAIVATTAWMDPAARAQAPSGFDSCDVNGAERVIAVGDVHGAYEQFVAILKTAGIIDPSGHWAGGQTQFVQTGDLVDRGPGDRKVLDLMIRLEREAPAAGGRVYALLGNHEVLTMLGEVRYLNPAESEEFRTPNSEALREAYYDRLLADVRNESKAAGRPFDEAAFRQQFLNNVRLGFVERQAAFGPAGEYGKWLRQHDAVVRINQVVFVHGGISKAVAKLGCAGINKRVHAELTTDFDKVVASQEKSLIAGPDGPLWYRGLAELGDKALTREVGALLARFNANAIVGGHTVTKGGSVRMRFDGKVFQIDTGMLSSAYAGGRASALEIKDGTFTAIYLDKRERLSGPSDKPAGAASRADTSAAGSGL